MELGVWWILYPKKITIYLEKIIVKNKNLMSLGIVLRSYKSRNIRSKYPLNLSKNETL